MQETVLSRRPRNPALPPGVTHWPGDLRHSLNLESADSPSQLMAAKTPRLLSKPVSLRKQNPALAHQPTEKTQGPGKMTGADCSERQPGEN